MDFVLWKPAKPGEPKWDSPWGLGRPGWHIECSAMIKKYLGDTIDIHGGGEDLIFPHHENEIAQSEAANNAPLARYWMHNGSITSGHKKMSKSLGNFTLLRDAAQKFSYQVIRFLLLNVHYRMPLEYSEALLGSAQSSLSRIQKCFDTMSYVIEKTTGMVLTEDEKRKTKEADAYRIAFENAMEDDFNTADALAAVFELVRFCNTHVSAIRPDQVSGPFVEALLGKLRLLCGLLGLELTQDTVSCEIVDASLSSKIEALIEERQEARKRKDWAAADKIRDELSEMNVVLEDTAGGVRWSFKTA